MKFYKEISGRQRIATSELIETNKMYPGSFDFDVENSLEISKEEFIDLNNDLTRGNAPVKLNARGCYPDTEIRDILIEKYLQNTWQDRYKAMKSGLGWTNADVAKLLDKSEGTVRRQVAPSSDRDFPAWGRAMVLMYEHFSNARRDGGG